VVVVVVVILEVVVVVGASRGLEVRIHFLYLKKVEKVCTKPQLGRVPTTKDYYLCHSICHILLTSESSFSSSLLAAGAKKSGSFSEVLEVTLQTESYRALTIPEAIQHLVIKECRVVKVLVVQRPSHGDHPYPLSSMKLRKPWALLLFVESLLQ